ncbi:A/G-specific adenine glycosylase [Corynebacterium lowii]|uniref:Adenine DNA glycosylase n=1 Tax=Corynebacterium lowii TaxID=1544413 RepID=A0A0Q0YV59_9CORY|nr:A/G-specific adenine glycosylase [Corynebacterium lowii]KQB86207.1 A/G-specific adenine glycosylase [Corynebacterium lowii]MDP9852681.1 A/G-specific adenine glycosylase [Corynebacterium lowii]
MNTLQDAVIAWYRTHARDLPWRTPGTTAWEVLLSEVMSQQTPVARVIPIWEQWRQRWPTPAHFADAGRDEVLRAWGRLGYPRRALRLHECAAEIVERFEGTVPAEVEELLSLPGIGEYTARAVACFHYGKNVPVVDTNVRRVYRRAIEGHFLAGTASKKELGHVAALLPEIDGPTFSVGLMELGALVCTAASPDCPRCPLLSRCAWQKAGCPQPSEEDKKRRRTQKYEGTDRHARGTIMALLRNTPTSVPMAQIDAAWPDAAQRSRALFGLLDDGLAEQLDDGTFRLPR